jgi:hypothetical protein
MFAMFERATAFNQNISRWNVSGVFTNFRVGSPLSNANTPPIIVRDGW